jgi:uncharacterized membrane protein
MRQLRRQKRYLSKGVWVASIALLGLVLKKVFPVLEYEAAWLNMFFDAVFLVLIELGIINDSTDPDHF